MYSQVIINHTINSNNLISFKKINPTSKFYRNYVSTQKTSYMYILQWCHDIYEYERELYFHKIK